MSGFNARRAPNVSQYLATLNHIPGPQDLSPQTDINIDDGLDFLTNAEFFDFDQFNPPPFDDHTQRNTADRSNSAQYGYADYQSYPPTTMTSPNTAAPSPPALQGQYPSQSHHYHTSPTAGDKRKASVSMPSTADLEEASRMAAEEDKRRRNTAASARFRVKKKQREQALEKQSKEMSEKVQQLEGKVQQLEMENKWLKELITEKSDVKTLDDALSLKKNEKESGERSRGSRTDGVGTVPAKVDSTNV